MRVGQCLDRRFAGSLWRALSRHVKGERDIDIQTTFGTRPRGDLGAMRFGDRLDDRKAEPMPGCIPNSFGSNLLEKLEQPANVLRRDDRTCVADE